jgi:hypothetical protein
MHKPLLRDLQLVQLLLHCLHERAAVAIQGVPPRVQQNRGWQALLPLLGGC